MNQLENLRVFVNKVLPTVYDDSLSYYELLTKVVEYLNTTIRQVNNLSKEFNEVITKTLPENVEAVLNEWYANGTLKDFVDIDLLSMKANVVQFEALKNKVDNIGVLNVKDFGAIGDGVTDDTEKFEMTISQAESGSTIYIPEGKYLIKRKLIIDKNISIIGSNMQDDTQNEIPLTGSVLLFNGLEWQGSAIEISANGVRMENLHISNISPVKTYIQLGINIKPFIGGVIWNISLKNLWVKGFGTHNIYGAGVLLSTFEHIYSSHSVNGFYFDNPTLNGTSLNFINCWAQYNTGYGFYFYKYYYSAMTGCASDVNNISYNFIGCNTITLTGCGSELTNQQHINISNSSEITLNGILGYDGNKLNTSENNTSFLNSIDSTNITLIGCKDLDPSNGAISLFSTNKLIIISSELPNGAYINNGGYANAPNSIIGNFVNLA